MLSVQKDVDSLKGEIWRMKRQPEEPASTNSGKVRTTTSGEDVVDDLRNTLRKEMWANHEDVIKVAEKVEKLEARISAAPSKRLRVDPPGAPATGLQNLGG